MGREKLVPFAALLLLMLLILLPAALALSQAERGSPGKGDRGAIRAIIEKQIDAFRRDDGAAAFSYASPSIREMFQTPERFMEMVRRGYQPVYRPRAVEFLELVRIGGEPVQQVFVVGPDGLPVLALYFMRRQTDGSWKINGCILLRPRGKAI